MRVVEMPKVKSTDSGETTHMDGNAHSFELSRAVGCLVMNCSIGRATRVIGTHMIQCLPLRKLDFVDAFGNLNHEMVPEKQSYLIDENDDESLSGPGVADCIRLSAASVYSLTAWDP